MPQLFLLGRKLQFGILLAAFMWLGTINVAAKTDVQFNDLLLHGIGYLIAVISAFIAYPRLNRFWHWLLFLFAYSFLIECIQYFLPWRSFSVLDLLANGSGVIAGYLIVVAAVRCWYFLLSSKR
jgi:glycopeptide antibiotics resistance protein